MNLRRAIGALALSFLASTAHAGVIIDNTFVGSTVNTFDPGATGSVLGFILQTGATYGESFAGQTLGQAGGFDTLSGSPSSPMTLQSNAVAADNIGVLFNAGSNVIYGDLNGTIGEGALSILFGSGVDGLGFDIAGVDGGGSFTVQFFDAAGALIASIVQAPANGYFGFRATAGSVIAGVSITNTDPAGVGYDNVQFNAVPEPASLTLLSLSMLGLALRRRKS